MATTSTTTVTTRSTRKRFDVPWWPDTDGDGYGDPDGTQVLDCFPPDGFANNPDDCDDTDPTIHPNVVELCDGVDNDCDAIVDEDCDPTDPAQTGDTGRPGPARVPTTRWGQRSAAPPGGTGCDCDSGGAVPPPSLLALVLVALGVGRRWGPHA